MEMSVPPSVGPADQLLRIISRSCAICSLCYDLDDLTWDALTAKQCDEASTSVIYIPLTAALDVYNQAADIYEVLGLYVKEEALQMRGLHRCRRWNPAL